MPRPRFVRHRTFDRLQHSTRFLDWLDAQAERIDTTAQIVFEELLVALKMTFEQVEQVDELVAPANTAVPVVTGEPIVGYTLTTTAGEWDGFPAPSLTYQWFRVDGEAEEIEGATGDSYTLTEEDEGLTVYVTVTATNVLDDESESSVETDEILAPAAPVNEVAPAVTGTAKQGEELEVVAGTWAGVPAPVLTYQWIRNDGEADTIIEGATDETYTLTEEDVDFHIFVREFATNDSGTEPTDSDPTAAVEAEGEE